MITTRDQLINAMANNSSRLIVEKASVAQTAAGQMHSLWRATGQPGQGAVPAAAANCNMASVGSIQFTPQTDPATSYLALLEFMTATAGQTFEIHDRLMHMGALNGNQTTVQTVGIDFNGVTTDNMVERRGDANYSDIQWWLEWYTDTGTTASTITVNVTYNDGTTGALSAISLAATRRASFMQPLNGFIPAAQSGKYIRGIVSVQLGTATGTAGSFGVTATRYRGFLYAPLANVRFGSDWAALGLPEIYNSSCLFLIVQPNGTSTGSIRGTGKIVHG